MSVWLSRAIMIIAITTTGAASADAVLHDADDVTVSQLVTRHGVTAEEEELIAAFDCALVELSRSLLTWIGERTDYEIDALMAEPPAIVFALIGDTLDFNGAELPVTAALHGAYVHSDNTIVLALPWHIDDPDDRSVLLHELVHAAQLFARQWRCLDETEWEAYQLQHQWLAEHGIELQLDWILVGMLSRCPEMSP